MIIEKIDRKIGKGGYGKKKLVSSGEYSDDRRHGYGDMTKANGRRYIGEFVQGRRHGKGQMSFPNGDKYTGDWQRGRRSGHGLYLFANGNR